MSTKRQATTDLNHDNWDQEDPAEKEEARGFKMALKEVLEKRVMRTPKRRTQVTGEEKSVFSGFSGFNKTQKPSMDFLANLTNGSKSNNGVSPPINDVVAVSTVASSTISKPAESQSGGIFSLSGTSAPITNSPFGQSTPESTIFGRIGTTPAFTQSVFSSSKPSLPVPDNPFKSQSSIISKPNVNFAQQSNANTDKSVAQASVPIFGGPPLSTSSSVSPFSTKIASPTSFKTPITSSSPQKNSDINKSASKSNVTDDRKLLYYNNLRGLNESVTAWIKKHVEETPLCILSPIFRDYEKHLKDIQEKYDSSSSQDVSDTKNDTDIKNNTDTKNNIETKNNTDANSNDDSKNNIDTKNITETKSTASFSGNILSSTFPSSNTSTNSVFSSTSSITSTKASTFSFGITTPNFGSANNLATAPVPSTGFTFGIKPSAASPFAATNTTVTAANTVLTAGNSNSPFSFGIGKPFAFNSNIKSNSEPANEGDDNEEPPQVEYTPIAEENSVYDIKCKVFLKKDGNYVDKGVATLYIKKIEESGKYQLLVRANTSLGNVLINLVLSSSIPTQRMGKNNVMMICIPTPDAKPPPSSILIRVKTSEDADGLLETLNKYKV